MAAVLNLQTTTVYYPLSSSLYIKKFSPPQFQCIPLSFTRKRSIFLSPPYSSLHNVCHPSARVKDEEETVIGDCVVFEEGVFDDPFLHPKMVEPIRKRDVSRQRSNSGKVEPENLIPEDWADVQKEINITKKEKRRLARELEFGSRVEKRRIGLRPIVLDNPVFPGAEEEGNCEKSGDECSVSSVSNTRVEPRNPRQAVDGGDLDDIREFFNGENYAPSCKSKYEEDGLAHLGKLYITASCRNNGLHSISNIQGLAREKRNIE
ncbi:unnamed protein product [Cuscuta epithymum]|uniref:Uncharacterized protein n=1 Tax=Cuscuta epithymum TaxID=186058 RepID=A0AAV0DA06_9ASTE|nr:unnamed protein product [Cuscuta epithymum]